MVAKRARATNFVAVRGSTGSRRGNVAPVRLSRRGELGVQTSVVAAFRVAVALSAVTAMGAATRVWAQDATPPASSSPSTGVSPAPDADVAPSPENAVAAQEARRHFMDGMAHYAARRFREAIRAFEFAAERVPSADLWFNIARAHEQLDEHERAADFYRRYLRDRVDPPDREAVERRIALLDERVEAERAARRARPTTGTLRVEATLAGAEVHVDGRSLGPTPLAAPLVLAPGPHTLEITRSGALPFRSEVRVEAGVTTSAYADLAPATEYRALRGTPVWAWVVGGLGMASLGTSLGFGIAAAGRQSDGDLDAARRSALVSDVFLGGGLVLAAGAALLYVLEGRAVGTERVTAVDGASARVDGEQPARRVALGSAPTRW
jgi:hypothetical protein